MAGAGRRRTAFAPDRRTESCENGRMKSVSVSEARNGFGELLRRARQGGGDPDHGSREAGGDAGAVAIRRRSRRRRHAAGAAGHRRAPRASRSGGFPGRAAAAPPCRCSRERRGDARAGREPLNHGDSSALVSLFVDEDRTADRLDLLRREPEVVTWRGSSVECVSAFHRLGRTRELDDPQLFQALARLAEQSATWIRIEPSERLRLRAGRLLGVHPPSAADAFQLAAATAEQPRSLDIVSSDLRLSAAAVREGLRVRRPRPSSFGSAHRIRFVGRAVDRTGMGLPFRRAHRRGALVGRRLAFSSLWTRRPAWESVLEEMGNPIVRADAGRFPHPMGAGIACRFRGEGELSPAALRAASAREGLSPQPARVAPDGTS